MGDDNAVKEATKERELLQASPSSAGLRDRPDREPSLESVEEGRSGSAG